MNGGKVIPRTRTGIFRVGIIKDLGYILLSVLLLAGVPILLGDLAFRKVLETRGENRRKQIYSNLEARMTRLLPIAEPETLLPPYLRRLARRARGKSDPTAFLVKMEKGLARTFPGLFSFIVFDGRDEVVFQTDGGSSRFLARKLLSQLRKVLFGRGRPEEFHSNSPMMFFLNDIGLKPRGFSSGFGTDWMPTSPGGRKTWLFQAVDERFSLFVHVHREAFSPIMGIARIISRARKPKYDIHVADMFTLRTLSTTKELSEDKVFGILLRCEREPITRFEDSGRLWVSGIIDSRFRVLLSAPAAPKDPDTRKLRLFRLAGLAILLLCGTLMGWLRFADPAPFFSIRWKLLGVFVLSTALPLSVLFFLLHEFLRERRDFLVQEACSSCDRILGNLDRQTILVNRFCEGGIQKLMSGFSPGLIRPDNSFLRNLEEFRRRTRCPITWLVGRKGFKLTQKDKKGPERVEWARFIPALLSSVLRISTGSLEERDHPDVKSSELLLESLMGDRSSTLIQEILGSRGKLQRIQIGFWEGFILIQILSDSQGRFSHVLAAGWESEDIAKLYFQKGIPLKPLDDGTELFVTGIEPETTWIRPSHLEKGRIGALTLWPNPDAGALHLPAKGKPGRRKPLSRPVYSGYPIKPLGRDFYRFFRMFLSRRLPCSDFISYKGENFIIAARRGENLSSYAFFALRPVYPIENEIDRLRLNIQAFAVICLSFTGFLGLFFARRFLDPVREISEGVRAAQSKVFQHRIPEGGTDELGDLSRQFNRMMESLEEVQLARGVQARLLPQRILEAGEFRIFGCSSPASELGGDFFDYIPIGDSQVLVIHGDVAGHGVPAALIMSMAKAVVDVYAHSPPDPEGLIHAMNGALLRQGKGAFLTLAVTVLDVGTGELSLINCANPYPFKVDTRGFLTEVRARGRPLGVRPFPSLTSTRFTLEPEERLLFYSDGILEALLNVTPEPCVLFREFLQAHIHRPIVEACRIIVDSNPFSGTGLPQPDDFTVLMIERRPLQRHDQGDDR